MRQKITYAIFLLACTGIFGFAIYSMYFPAVYDITPRAYVGMVLADTVSMRKSIAENLSKGKPASVTKRFSALPGKKGMVMNIDFGWVTPEGSIVVYNKEHEVVVIQEPTKVGKIVNWSCTIYPESARPKTDICNAGNE
jgi:hypothetical protein